MGKGLIWGGSEINEVIARVRRWVMGFSMYKLMRVNVTLLM